MNLLSFEFQGRGPTGTKSEKHTSNLVHKPRVLIVRPSEAQARKPYDLYLSRIVMEFQNS